MAISIDVQKLIDGLKIYFEGTDDVKLKLNELKDTGFDFGILLACLQDGAKVIDKIARDSKEMVIGEVKKKALANFLDDVVKLPYLFDSVLKIDDMAIDGLIDGYIYLMNSKFGSKWAEEVEAIL